jgi:NAD(P)-dependent dehydrogenase (short-subunit alcohol dehydrogenase family)
MIILITGVAGFISVVLVQRLLERGDRVVGVRQSERLLRRIAQSGAPEALPGVGFEVLDITDHAGMAHLFRDNRFDARLKTVPTREGYVPATHTDTHNLVLDAGLDFATPAEVGVVRFVEWHKGYGCSMPAFGSCS